MTASTFCLFVSSAYILIQPFSLYLYLSLSVCFLLSVFLSFLCIHFKLILEMTNLTARSVGHKKSGRRKKIGRS